jgi:hypothetical protein
MGLLDDAIKEHLDLKRKHGAPEEVVQRQEEEALGPVRRDAAEQPKSAETELVEAGGDEAPAAEEPPRAADDVVGEPGEPEEPDELTFEEDEFLAAEEAEGSVSDPGATQEYDPFADEDFPREEEPARADREERSGEEGGDVLEDTPDFLQETPEHDRLWFEQKPPRDFDFE